MKNLCFHLNKGMCLIAVMLLAIAFPSLAQKITVTGHVSDEQGEDLIGATIIEKGTSNGTAADIDGNFTIEVPSNAVLTVSYVGYDPMDVHVNGQTHLNIVMKENATMLAETVVIGYGSVKKSDATGSVALVTPDAVEAGISTSAQDLLVGASPGVVVTPDGGKPDGAANIRIRGGASLSASNDPLIVLDGVPLANDGVQGMANPLAMIAPDNIESMTILKDASATAIYGSRASNGVIIINTKRGKGGKPQLNFSANFAVNTPRKTWNVMSADKFSALIREHWGADSEAAAQLGTASTNWQDKVLRTSFNQEYSLSIGGKAGFLPYRVSASYTMNNGILKDSQMQRVTAGFNLTPEFFGGLLKINANVKGYYMRNRFSNEGAVGAAIAFDPTQPVYSNNATGNPDFPYFYNGYTSVTTDRYNSWNINGTVNPVAVIKDSHNVSNVFRSNGNFQVDYALHFLPELHLNLNLGYDVSRSFENKNIAQNSPTSWNEGAKNGAGSNYHVYEMRRNTLLDFYLNYKKDFQAIQSYLDVMAGYSWQRFDAFGHNNGTVYTSNGFYGPSTTNGVLTIDPNTTKPGDHFNPDYSWNTGNLMLVSFFGRLNYTFKDTYLLTVTLRDDGTSRFSKNNRWGLFPSVALGWKISEMPFFEKARETMNEFKLRLGWGVTGQQSVGGYFPYMPVYVQSTNTGSFYPNLYTGKYEGNISTLYPGIYNPDLKWEETTTWNVGLDMGWLNNRITLALDWYLRESKDLLSYVTVAPGGATSNMMDQNIGTLQNLGVEGTITAKPVVTDNFTWTTSLNVAWNKNKITKLNATDDENSYITAGGISGGKGNTVQVHKVGYPAYTYSLYEQVYDQNGDPIEGCYVDQNGDGTIDDNDRVLRHSKDPKVTMAWNNSFSWKGWDLSFQLRASIGNYVYNDVLSTHSTLSDTYNTSGIHNIIDAEHIFKGGETTNRYLSNYWLRNASFLRCDNITLGYTWTDIKGEIPSVRLYGAVQNPFVITGYNGLDPEVFWGIDNNIYPRPITVTLGVMATF